MPFLNPYFYDVLSHEMQRQIETPRRPRNTRSKPPKGLGRLKLGRLLPAGF